MFITFFIISLLSCFSCFGGPEDTVKLHIVNRNIGRYVASFDRSGDIAVELMDFTDEEINSAIIIAQGTKTRSAINAGPAVILKSNEFAERITVSKSPPRTKVAQLLDSRRFYQGLSLGLGVTSAIFAYLWWRK